MSIQRPKTTKVRVYDFRKTEDRDKYEALLNEQGITIDYISREEVHLDKATGRPVITVWYDEFKT